MFQLLSYLVFHYLLIRVCIFQSKVHCRRGGGGGWRAGKRLAGGTRGKRWEEGTRDQPVVQQGMLYNVQEDSDTNWCYLMIGLPLHSNHYSSTSLIAYTYKLVDLCVTSDLWACCPFAMQGIFSEINLEGDAESELQQTEWLQNKQTGPYFFFIYWHLLILK